ncbi:hypothetical protein J6590_018676 [Homalodisca vitripennis]|nr:hypothetical protein J6590_018676 [Homalodisca vitripennis]
MGTQVCTTATATDTPYTSHFTDTARTDTRVTAAAAELEPASPSPPHHNTPGATMPTQQSQRAWCWCASLHNRLL